MDWIRVHAPLSELVDKLLILDYAREFRSRYKSPPISRHSPPDWFSFVALIAFLSDDQRVQDVESASVDEVVQVITHHIPDSQISESNVREAETQLRVLNALADKKLVGIKREGRITIKGMEEAEAEAEDEDVVENELIMEDEDATQIMIDDEDDGDEDGPHMNESQPTSQSLKQEIFASKLVPKVDEKEWKLEVERVRPQLRVTANARDVANWRTRVVQLRALKRSLEEDGTRDMITKWSKEVSSARDKVSNREKYLASQLDNLELVTVRAQLDKVREEYSSCSVGVTHKTATLNSLSEEAESIRAQLEATGQTLSGDKGGGLSEGKRTLALLEEEEKLLSVRVGVTQNTLLVKSNR